MWNTLSYCALRALAFSLASVALAGRFDLPAISGWRIIQIGSRATSKHSDFVRRDNPTWSKTLVGLFPSRWRPSESARGFGHLLGR
jgi:hypothetical protein